MQHTLATKDKFFNVKFVIRLLNGLVITHKYRILTDEQMERKTCYDIWNDGKTFSVNVYVEGKLYCGWKLSRGEMPLPV